MPVRTITALAAAAGLALSLVACSATDDDTTASTASATERTSALIGSWRMTELEDRASGDYEAIPYSGQIVISPTSVAVQAMNPDTAAPDGPYTVNGYEAFYGPVDIRRETFTVDVESAAVRDLIGQTLSRNYDASDDELVLTPTDPAETWRVTYERID